jgi:hypothetical protein
LDGIEHLDFLFGEPSSANRLDPSKTAKKSFVLHENGLSLANKLQQKRVAKECADWIQQKVDIKTIRQSNLLHGKMYHVANGGVEEAILGSSNFTVCGLGLGNGGNNIELNLIVDGNRDRQELKQWFSDVWNDDKLVKDVKEDVLLYLHKLYANQPPQFIYYLTLYHLFRDYLEGTRDLDDNLRRMCRGSQGRTLPRNFTTPLARPLRSCRQNQSNRPAGAHQGIGRGQGLSETTSGVTGCWPSETRNMTDTQASSLAVEHAGCAQNLIMWAAK